MDLANYSREQLIELIEELTLLNETLLEEKRNDDRLDFAWTGNLGHWYYNVKANKVVFNPLKVEALGYTMEELPDEVPYQFFTEKLHPEDYEKTMDAMKKNMMGLTPVYECEYRIQAKDGSWKWFYDRGQVTRRDASGYPLFVAGIVFDITERKMEMAELEMENRMLAVESMTDALTGIRNRGAILDELESRMEKASIYKSPLSIVMFDIDHFKPINDTKGHVFGDQVLKEVAKIINNEIRGLDTLGRYGGEEFLLILPNTSRKSALQVAERIRRKVAEEAFSNDIQVTISGGAAEYKDQEMLDLIDNADKNLYASKQNGRNRITG
ncbi:sensor domain-containing diguanylate cyclase [Proteiniclasticum sp. SCR006]|uniref:Sensor domain-containing diguanylate cyclase n=1 Tax=Proteiniclasticum aestuarii TaxID=2817862 RepID=A0A939H4E0_9CLOT|nr:sensor domain-containing diguanylate cyclase [Proteiniclasticum aestuarii]MBO1263987.1 sensor domain-containing diguanylate cyclase [Proteiniclasticum aestuarii]